MPPDEEPCCEEHLVQPLDTLTQLGWTAVNHQDENNDGDSDVEATPQSESRQNRSSKEQSLEVIQEGEDEPPCPRSQRKTLPWQSQPQPQPQLQPQHEGEESSDAFDEFAESETHSDDGHVDEDGSEEKGDDIEILSKLNRESGGSKGSRFLSGMSASNIIEISDDEAASPVKEPQNKEQKSHRYATRGAAHGRSDAIYSSSWHPMDAVTRPKRAARLGYTTIEVHEDSFDEDAESVVDYSDEDVQPFHASTSFPSGPVRRSTRKRKTRGIRTFSQHVHPQDSSLAELGIVPQRRKRTRLSSTDTKPEQPQHSTPLVIDDSQEEDATEIVDSSDDDTTTSSQPDGQVVDEIVQRYTSQPIKSAKPLDITIYEDGDNFSHLEEHEQVSTGFDWEKENDSVSSDPPSSETEELSQEMLGPSGQDLDAEKAC